MGEIKTYIQSWQKF